MRVALLFLASPGTHAVRRIERDNLAINKYDDYYYSDSDAQSDDYSATNADLPADVLKGISWGPMPLKESDKGRKTPHDDFFNDEAVPIWGDTGRGDLSIMKDMGANAVRLYGNHPGLQHGKFFEAADALQMSVIPGLSDYPYTQMAGNCLTTDFVCYSQVKDSYTGNLKGGFLRSDKTYHPALKSLILINEPDLKLGALGGPEQMRALISAFDGALDAEKEQGVVDPKLKFTMTFSFAVCTRCSGSQKPGLGQMMELRDAMKDPASVNYTSKNDLWEAYLKRFENSFNTANPSQDLKPLILDDYNKAFQESKIPIYIGEYHTPKHPALEADLKKALSLTAEPGTLFKGYSFFEWQVRYDKGGTEMEFGMFGLGSARVDSFPMTTGAEDGGAEVFDIWCVEPVDDIPSAVAAAYGGRVPRGKLC